MENNENKQGKKELIPGGNKTILGVIILLLIIGYAVYAKKPAEFSLGKLFTESISQEEAKAKTKDFIEKNLVAPGTVVEIKSITEEGGLYKITLDVAGQEIVSYLTKDGTKFFPQVIDIAEIEKQAQGDQSAAAPQDIPKTDAPEVQLFVMSYCPYGTQIEKGILPVVDTLGNKIKFSLKFVDYAMHGKKEVDENLRQYCIQKEGAAKLSDYLSCFLQSGEGTENNCMQLAGVNKAKTDTCIKAADTEFKVTGKFNDKSTWSNGQYPPFDVDKADNDKFAVQGSPTLVINGVTASAGRDSASLLKTICGAFNNAPAECQQELSAETPSAGFGAGNSAAGSDSASCH